MASIALTTEHELRAVLQKVIDLSRELIRARYGALGILDETGQRIDRFITSGVSPSAQAQIERLPVGSGILGISLFQGQSVRIANVVEDRRASGFPPNHPHIHSFLGVPIASKGRIFGNLYLADKLPERDDRVPFQSHEYLEFTAQDQELLEMFAAQAAIAIEDAHLYRENRQIAVMRERERIGMDLHDGVIQSIYAVGLMLDDTQHRLRTEPDLAEERISNAISGLNSVIRDIRAYIQDLRSPDFPDKNVELGIEELIAELEAYSVLEVSADIDPTAVAGISQRNSTELLHIVQEALTNIRKHSHASIVNVSLSKDNHRVKLIIEDDGVGFTPETAQNGAGHGLRNMAERALKARGSLELSSAPGAGTTITVSMPLDPASVS
jgi:signal transduction histidine kinase